MRPIWILLYKKMRLEMSDSTKEIVQYSICVLCILGAMIMSFIALYMDPEGEIHDSILWICGQVLVFVGSIFGISSVHNVQLRKIDTKMREIEKNNEKV